MSRLRARAERTKASAEGEALKIPSISAVVRLSWTPSEVISSRSPRLEVNRCCVGLDLGSFYSQNLSDDTSPVVVVFIELLLKERINNLLERFKRLSAGNELALKRS